MELPDTPRVRGFRVRVEEWSLAEAYRLASRPEGVRNTELNGLPWQGTPHRQWGRILRTCCHHWGGRLARTPDRDRQHDPHFAVVRKK